MTTQAKRVLDQALQLPSRERINLAEKLWSSVEDQEWIDELHKRTDEMRQGKVKGIPIAKALAQLGKRGNGSSRKR